MKRYTRSSIESPPDWENLNNNSISNLKLILKELEASYPDNLDRDELIALIKNKINSPHLIPFKSSKMIVRDINDDFEIVKESMLIEEADYVEQFPDIYPENPSNSEKIDNYIEERFENRLYSRNDSIENPDQESLYKGSETISQTIVSMPKQSFLFPKVPPNSSVSQYSPVSTQTQSTPRLLNSFSSSSLSTHGVRDDLSSLLIFFGSILVLFSSAILARARHFPCPEHAICSLFSFTCRSGFHAEGDQCIDDSISSETYLALKAIRIISNEYSSCIFHTPQVSTESLLLQIPDINITHLFKTYNVFENEYGLLEVSIMKPPLICRFIIYGDKHPSLAGFLLILVFTLVYYVFKATLYVVYIIKPKRTRFV